MKRLVVLMVMLFMLVFGSAAMAETTFDGGFSADLTSDFVWRGMKMSSDDLSLAPKFNFNIHPFSVENTVYFNMTGVYGDFGSNDSDFYFKNIDLGFERVLYKGLYAQVGYNNVTMDDFFTNTMFDKNVHEMYAQIGYDFTYDDVSFGPFYRFSKDVENYDWNYHEAGIIVDWNKQLFASYTVSYMEDMRTDMNEWVNGEAKVWAVMPLTETVYVKPMVGYSHAMSDQSEAFLTNFNAGSDEVWFTAVSVGFTF